MRKSKRRELRRQWLNFILWCPEPPFPTRDSFNPNVCTPKQTHHPNLSCLPRARVFALHIPPTTRPHIGASQPKERPFSHLHARYLSAAFGHLFYLDRVCLYVGSRPESATQGTPPDNCTALGCSLARVVGLPPPCSNTQTPPPCPVARIGRLIEALR